MILAKILPIVDPNNGQDFFDEIKSHYACTGDNSKMTLERVARLCISWVGAFEKVSWLRIWNSNKEVKNLA